MSFYSSKEHRAEAKDLSSAMSLEIPFQNLPHKVFLKTLAIHLNFLSLLLLTFHYLVQTDAGSTLFWANVCWMYSSQIYYQKFALLYYIVLDSFQVSIQ